MIPVAKPPWTKLGRTIESCIRKALHEHAMLGHDKLAVALSGGKDSLTLLFMLKAILGRGFPKLELLAIHVDGAFSCGAGLPSNYVQEICRQIDVPLIIKTASITREKLSCYPCSRERRRLLFTAAKEGGATTIAFGHHRDDHNQTLLMNLLHKGEFVGNLPKLKMVDYGVTIVRPLMYVSERQIWTFAQEMGYARVTCQCPVGAHSMRKKVDEVIERLEPLFPNVRSNLAQAGWVYGSDKAKREEQDNDAHITDK